MYIPKGLTNLTVSLSCNSHIPRIMVSSMVFVSTVVRVRVDVRCEFGCWRSDISVSAPSRCEYRWTLFFLSSVHSTCTFRQTMKDTNSNKKVDKNKWTDMCISRWKEKEACVRTDELWIIICTLCSMWCRRSHRGCRSGRCEYWWSCLCLSLCLQ